MIARARLLSGIAFSLVWIPSVAVANAKSDDVAADAQSQSPSPNTPVVTAETAAAPAPTDNGDIVITGRGQREAFMRTPVSVTVLDQRAIQRYQVLNLADIGQLVPQLIISPYKVAGTGGSFTIRGIGASANQIGFENPVSVSIDGVQTSQGRIALFGFFDLARVEVLSGPQALFGGKNALAGIVALTSALPTDHLEASMTGSYEFNGQEITTDYVVSGPLTRDLGARLALRYRDLRGYLINTAQPIANPFYRASTGAPSAAAMLPGAAHRHLGENEIDGRGTLRYVPSSNVTAILRVTGTRYSDDGGGAGAQNIGPCVGPNPRVNGIPDPYGDCVPDNRTTVGDVPPVIASTVDGFANGGVAYSHIGAVISSLNVSADLGNMLLSSVTGYNNIHTDGYTGQDQTTYSQIASTGTVNNRDFTQEIRLNSNFQDSVNFTLGAFFQDSSIDAHQDVKTSDAFYNAAANRYSTVDQVASQSGKVYSVFGQGRWNIIPTLELAGGVRWTREQKDLRKHNLYGVVAFYQTSNTTFPGSDEIGVLKVKYDESNWSPEATLTWHPSANFTAYGGYRTGFLSGGFGMTAILNRASVPSDFSYNSEKSRGFEGGVKALLADRHLRVNAALFEYNYKDLQVTTYNPAALAYQTHNAGQLKQRGFEADANYSVTRSLVLRGAVTYARNRFHNFIGQCYSYTFPTGATRATATPPPNCEFQNTTTLTLEQNYEGRPPARSPDWVGNTGFTYSAPLGRFGLELNGDAFYSGSYYASDTLVEASKQRTFWRFNASIGIKSPDERYRLDLIGRNLTNKYYLLYAADRTGGTGVPGAIGEQRGVVSRGREILLQASVKL